MNPLGRRMFLLTLLAALVQPVSSMAAQDNQPTPIQHDPITLEPAQPPREEPGPQQKPPVEQLGNGLFRVGRIEIDQNKSTLRVPGYMLPGEPTKAIEFLATTPGVYKSSESVMDLHAIAFEFNLASILIGLDAERAVAPEFHFDPTPLQGDRVEIRVSWLQGGQRIDRDAVDLLRLDNGKPPKPSVWIYTGSGFNQAGDFMAEVDGVLIGMVHAPASIFEHREGMGLGQWGALTIDPEIAPGAGQEIELTVRFPRP